ncbi:hypothetical protein ACJX0J_019908, partial [Zea mays]
DLNVAAVFNAGGIYLNIGDSKIYEACLNFIIYGVYVVCAILIQVSIMLLLLILNVLLNLCIQNLGFYLHGSAEGNYITIFFKT